MPPQSPVPPELIRAPFRLDEAIALGVSRDVLRGARFRRVLPGVYAAVELPDGLATRADAALLIAPEGAVLSHQTAALLHGLPVPDDGLVHVSVGSGGPDRRVSGVRMHRVSTQVVLRESRPLSSPVATFVGLAGSLGLLDLVVLGDAMVGRRMTSCAELVAAAASMVPRRGRRLARRAAGLVQPGVDSPMETRVRLMIVFAGLPEPTPNLVVRDELGGWIGEVDLGYAAARVAIEYHGDVHRTVRGQWRSDVAKVELLGELGWHVVVLTADDVLRHPARTLARVHAALVRVGHPGLPAAPSDGWRSLAA